MTEETKTPKLTLNDPIASETLERFTKLGEAQHNLALQLLRLEQNKIRLLAAAHQLDEQEQRLFEKVLVERGLPPTAQVEIDTKTGILRVLSQPTEAPKEPPKAAA